MRFIRFLNEAVKMDWFTKHSKRKDSKDRIYVNTLWRTVTFSLCFYHRVRPLAFIIFIFATGAAG